MLLRFSLPVLALLVGGLVGCSTKTDPLACAEACGHQDQRTFCDIDGVFPGTELENECIVPPSPGACNRVETCDPQSNEPVCSDVSMGVCVECDADDQCGKAEVCSVDGSCENYICTQDDAGNMACDAFDDGVPYCSPENRCEECSDNRQCTSASAEICDLNNFKCRGCEANSDCTSLACGIQTGMCVSDTKIVYVDDDNGTMDDADCGTLASPCATIMFGLGKVMGPKTILVVLEGSYPERILTSDVEATIIGIGSATIEPDLENSNDRAVEVGGTAQIVLDGFTIAPTSSIPETDAVFCTGSTASLSILNSRVVGAQDKGVINESCTLTITGSSISLSGGIGVISTDGSLNIFASTITKNERGGIDIVDGNFNLVNNFIVENGSTVAVLGGLRIINVTAILQILDFNTIADNVVNTGANAVNVECNVNTAVNAVLNLSGNIVWGGGTVTGAVPPKFLGDTCPFEFSLIEGAGASGTILDEDPLFESAVGDYHILEDSPCKDAADEDSLVITDFDGDERPQGGQPDIGADEVK